MEKVVYTFNFIHRNKQIAEMGDTSHSVKIEKWTDNTARTHSNEISSSQNRSLIKDKYQINSYLFLQYIKFRVG